MATRVSDYIVPLSLYKEIPWQLEYQITLPTDHLSVKHHSNVARPFHVQLLITCSMQKQRRKAWSINFIT